MKALAAVSAGVLVLLLAFGAREALSHPDRPGPPPLIVRVYLESFRFTDPQNDGAFENNAEAAFSWALDHFGHAMSTDSIPQPRTGALSNEDLPDGTTW